MANENKVSNFTPDSLENKFLAEANTDETKDVDRMFSQVAAVTLNKTRFEKQHVFHLSNQMRIPGGNQEVIFLHSLFKENE